MKKFMETLSGIYVFWVGLYFITEDIWNKTNSKFWTLLITGLWVTAFIYIIKDKNRDWCIKVWNFISLMRCE